jgi:glyoxylase-like metal-dependent hydrolase (beta-lactamase superfamily II)
MNPTNKMFKYRDANPDEALFFWTGGPVEVAERTWFQSMFSGCTAFETDDGLVLVDSGTVQFGPTLAQMVRQRTSRPVHTAIFTHGHIDHAYGLKEFLQPGQALPRVIAQQAALERFARYAKTPRHNQTINARQFGGAPPADEAPSWSTFHAPAVAPDTVYENQMEVSVGSLTFELYHCRGETDDHTWVWCPERGVLCPGDLFIYCAPNAGNPQKAQRYPWDWAAGLRQMATLRPRSLCPGHGGPVVNDPEKINRMLLETAEYLETIVAETLAAIEDGSPPHVDIVRRVRIPPATSPWLQPVYDEGEFIVRNVIRFFGGWWSGRPSELKPAPRQALAAELANLCGGAGRMAHRARELAVAGQLQLACHLADFALEAAPADAEIQAATADLYAQRAQSEQSLMAVNLFNSAAAYARAGRAFS